MTGFRTVGMFLCAMLCAGAAGAQTIRIERLLDGPIITPDMDRRMGSNIAGPSLIRVPDWVENPLGRYYLYFADHRGLYIRLAYADDLAGPWTMHEPGTLQIEQSHFPATCPPCGADSPNPAGAYAHIASPDVHVIDERQEIVMYVHGRERGPQVTRAAVSRDGLHFEGRPESLGRAYFRAFRHDGYWYALAMPGVMYRSRDGLTGFEEGPSLFNPDMRHSALLKRGNRLFVFWTERGDAPERVWLASIDISQATGGTGRRPRGWRCCARSGPGRARTCRWSRPAAAPSTFRSTSCATRRSSKRTAASTSCTRSPASGGSGSPRYTWIRSSRALGATRPAGGRTVEPVVCFRCGHQDGLTTSTADGR